MAEEIKGNRQEQGDGECHEQNDHGCRHGHGRSHRQKHGDKENDDERRHSHGICHRRESGDGEVREENNRRHRPCHGRGHRQEQHGEGDSSKEKNHGHGHGHRHSHGDCRGHEHGHGDDHGHRHGPSHGHGHGHEHGHGDNHGHRHGHGHGHGHGHKHGDDHGHRHGSGHGHDHGRGHKHGHKNGHGHGHEHKQGDENYGGPRQDHEHDSSNDGSVKKYPLVFIRGLAFPSPFLLASNVEAAIDFKPRDSDIFVVTYPKCGTTWTQYMVWEILHKGAVPPSPNQIVFRDFPFLEFTGVETLEDIPPPRTMKTHLPFNLQPYNPKTKYIYIVRNPWDCCVSYYYHHQIDPAMPQMTFDEYFEEFIKGEVGWGDFFDNVLSWFEHRNDPNVLFLKYEEMKKDKKKTLLGIAKFMGESHYKAVQNEEVLANCLKHSDFKYMKELGMFFPKGEDTGLSSDTIKDVTKLLGDVDRSKANPEEFAEVNFFRKGEVGDWKNHFTPSHIKKFNEYMLRKVKNTEMENFWQPLQEETSF